jgi:excisionase family DNA binding protein
MSQTELLTVDEVAKMLRVQIRAVYSKVKKNQIPGVFRTNGSSGRIRFDKQKVLDWIAQGGN